MAIPDDFPMAATMWWSFGRDRRMLADIRNELEDRRIRVIDIWSDPDLNRTLVAFSGEHTLVSHCALELLEVILPSIDLRRHTGTHPRTGALDQVRFSPLNNDFSGIDALEVFGSHLSAYYQIPVFADGPDSDAASERRILELREGGFGKMQGRSLEPDFGSPTAHEQYGVVTVFVGPHQLLASLELDDPTAKVAQQVAEELQTLRFEGDPMLYGVHTEGFAQPTREGSLLLLTFEMPNEAYPDQVLKIAEKEARLAGAAAGKARALGVWRTSDLGKATRLILDEETQVWDDVYI